MVAIALAAVALAGCPHDSSLGTVSFPRAGAQHTVSLTDCRDRVTGRAATVRRDAIATPDGRFVAAVRRSGSGRSAQETIWVTSTHTHRSHPVTSETEYYKQIGPGDTAGPIVLLRFSTDGRWLFFTVDPGGSGSIAADGLTLRVVSGAGGAVTKLGTTLPYPGYLSWCGGRIVFVGGGDRVAIHAKRLLVAGPPDWRPMPLWADASRSFASPACAPDGRSVAVLSQHSSTNANFFATRWRLWRVTLAGSRTLLDVPPSKTADEEPQWSRDGRSVLFVRERNGYGQLMLRRAGHTIEPFADLGYAIGYYGYHDWRVRWSVGAP